MLPKYWRHSKSSVVILCLLLFNDMILDGLGQDEVNDGKPPGEREIEIEYEHKQPEKKSDSKPGKNDQDDDSAKDKPDSGMGLGENQVKDGIVKPLDTGMPAVSFPQAGKGIAGLVGTGTMRIKKQTISGLTRALDDRAAQLDRWGDPHMGMPADALGHLLHCAQFVYSGLYVLIYLTIRYPLKIVQKAVLFTGAIQHITTYASRCLNPISILDFAQSGQKHNAHLERFAQFKYQILTRWQFIADKANHEDRQKYTCCSWHEYKFQIFAEAPEIVWFAKRWFYGNYKLPELVYCMQYQEGSKPCEETDLTILDQPPDRVVVQSCITAVMEILDKYI